MTIRITFWGARGTTACPGADYAIFGGNTSCVELDIDGHRVVLDAGTGLRKLGAKIIDEGPRKSTTILLSHTHHDHIAGLSTYRPLYHPDYRTRLVSGTSLPFGGLEQVLNGHLSEATFPVSIDEMPGESRFDDFAVGENFRLGSDIRVITRPLAHKGGATGYRIEHGGRSLCYVTDTEHSPGRMDRNVLELIKDADLVIYDSTYTDEEFGNYAGWGHSTWQEGIRLCQKADAKWLMIFHHDPDKDDRQMGKIAKLANDSWPYALVAREGQSFDLDVLVGLKMDQETSPRQASAAAFS